jgi:hypothetical protein
VAQARAVLAPLIGVLAEGGRWPAAEPLRAELAQWIAEDAAVADWVRAALPEGPAVDPAAVLACTVSAWVRLHGVVGIEAAGTFGGMGLSPATLLAVEVDALADGLGLPRA